MTPAHDPNTAPVFAYWDNDDHSRHDGFLAEWRGHFPQFRILGDAEALPLLAKHLPQYLELYKAIRIPAARSDIARCILLYAHGGVYTDCHFGIRDIIGLRAEIERLADVDMIVLNRAKPLSEWQREEHVIINGMIFARPGLPLMLEACAAGLENLACYRQKQLASGQRHAVPYDIWSLTGPRVLTALLFDSARCNRVLRHDLQGRIRVLPEAEAPVQRLVHQKYRATGMHWATRQRTEPLFEL